MQQLAPSSVSCAKIELSADFMLPVVSIVRQKRGATWASILNQEQAGLHLRLGWGNLRMHSAGFVQRAAIARLSAYVFAPANGFSLNSLVWIRPSGPSLRFSGAL